MNNAFCDVDFNKEDFDNILLNKTHDDNIIFYINEQSDSFWDPENRLLKCNVVIPCMTITHKDGYTKYNVYDCKVIDYSYDHIMSLSYTFKFKGERVERVHPVDYDDAKFKLLDIGQNYNNYYIIRGVRKNSNGDFEYLSQMICSNDNVRIHLIDEKHLAYPDEKINETLSIFPEGRRVSYNVKTHKLNRTFEPFDKVLFKSFNNNVWECGLFNRYDNDSDIKIVGCDKLIIVDCIPYTEKTKHLVGTTNNYIDDAYDDSFRVSINSRSNVSQFISPKYK